MHAHALLYQRMNDETALLENIKKLAEAKKYRIRLDETPRPGNCRPWR
jgi:hypothetical protein